MDINVNENYKPVYMFVITKASQKQYAITINSSKKFMLEFEALYFQVGEQKVKKLVANLICR